MLLHIKIECLYVKVRRMIDVVYFMLKLADWVAIRPYEIILYIIARMTGRVFVGPELCRNEEWVQLLVRTTIDAFAAAKSIRASYPPR